MSERTTVGFTEGSHPLLHQVVMRIDFEAEP